MTAALRPHWLLNYGLMGWALGAVAVPIYIQVPYLYSRILEVPSAWVGTILLLSRLLDAVLDPLIGLWVDKRQHATNRYLLPIVLACPFLLLGMYGVFFPLGSAPKEYAMSLMGSLILVHLGYSLASIAYQAWGAELGATDKQRSTFVAVREGLGILGVVFAVSLSLETHANTIYTGFAVMLGLGLLLLVTGAPKPPPGVATTHGSGFIWQELFKPLSHPNFRALMLVFLCNGLAAALPATLVPFYMRDRLGLDESDQWVLAVYFLVGAGSTVFWVWLAGRIGLTKTWLTGMVISVPAFVLVVMLGEGDLNGYLVVCILTGFALGADLSMPAALVAKLIRMNGEQGQTEGTYFGLWNWVNKFNLALAPSLALGALQWFAYTADAYKDPVHQALGMLERTVQDPLLWMYALLPCGLKLLAVVLLHRARFDEMETQHAQ